MGDPSIWDKAGDFATSGKWTHWPKPFNGITNIRVLACNDGVWIADITFYAKFIGRFLFSNFFPSPVEIFRKTLTGGYRCGFYLKPLQFAPGDLLWGEATTRVIAQILSPFTRGLFYWWAAETAWSALDAWHSLIYEQARCEAQQFNAVMNDGFYNQHVAGTGSPTAYEIIYDQDGICQATNGFFRKGDGAAWAFTAIELTNSTAETAHMSAWISGCPVLEASPYIFTIAPGGTISFSLEGYTVEPHADIQVAINLNPAILSGGNVTGWARTFILGDPPLNIPLDPNVPKNYPQCDE